MRRCSCVLLFLVGAALAGSLRFKHLLDPTNKDFPLTAYEWKGWKELDKATRLRAKGSDPEAWENPEPWPETEEEKKKREEREERRKKAIEQGRPEYPQHKVPGFHFDNRLKRKQQAFETLVQPASASKLEGLVKQLKKLDKALVKYERYVDEVREEYDQVFKQRAKAESTYAENWKKKHGSYPETVSLPRSLIVASNRLGKRMQRVLAIRQSELQFHEWLVGRLRTLIGELSPDERAKPVAALAAGMKDKDWQHRARCAAILGSLGDPQSVAAFQAAMDKEKDPLVLADLIRIRVGRGGDGVMELLKRRLEDPLWPVRAVAIRGLGDIPKKESVDLLVARMEKEDGRLLDDITAALKKLTGQAREPTAASWKSWWEKHRENWTPPKKGAASDARTGKEMRGGGVYFYGIRSSSKRIIFCVDISGSMDFPLDGRDGKKPPRIETAKRELTQALSAMPEDARFNIVVYSAGVRVWKKKLQQGSQKNKQAARKFVDRLKCSGATNIFDALVKSMEIAAQAEKSKEKNPEADTIYFLTDGVPSHGRIIDPNQILEEITKRNALLGIVIHCVGVSKEQNRGFLLNLAKRNGGHYVGHK